MSYDIPWHEILLWLIEYPDAEVIGPVGIVESEQMGTLTVLGCGGTFGMRVWHKNVKEVALGVWIPAAPG